MSHSDRGFTFVELIVATAVMMILASAAIPLVRVSIRRQQETELHRDLRDMRGAIDRFHDMMQANMLSSTANKLGCEDYPESLDILVEGVTRANDTSGKKIKFLRRVPQDPITGRTDWGMRSYTDAPDATVWGGDCVYDVYSKADGKGLNGTKYRDW